jgi:hypothetical protein
VSNVFARALLSAAVASLYQWVSNTLGNYIMKKVIVNGRLYV